MSFFENTRDPKGFGGRLMVTMMNLAHTPVALWGLHFLHLAPDAKVLDCGCGGGANIKRLLKRCPRGIVKGVDYSAVSVEKSRRLNAEAIQGIAVSSGRAACSASFLPAIGSMQSQRLKPSISGRTLQNASGRFGGF